MSDDWQPGDLALCVTKMAPCQRDLPPCPIRPGFIGTVSEVDYSSLWDGRPVWLGFPDFSAWFDAGDFRKIRPHQPDAEDRKTIELLTSKPARVPA